MPHGRSRQRRSPTQLPRPPPSTARRFQSCPSSTRSSAPPRADLHESIDRRGLVRSPDAAGRPARAAPGCLCARRAPPFHRRSRAAREPRHRGRDRARRAANLKVTEPADLDVVRAIAARRGTARRAAARSRFGMGQDSHGFGPDVGLSLAASRWKMRRACTAIPTATSCSTPRRPPSWRAAGLGDLGRLFPPSDERTRGIDSAELLAAAVAQAAQAGWPWPSRRCPWSVPGPARSQRIDAMRDRLAQLLGPNRESVDRGIDRKPLRRRGAGRVISATCLVSCIGDDARPMKFTNTLGGKRRGVQAARGRTRPHVQLRPDGLRARPRRQFPRVPAGLTRCALPDWSGLRSPG